ncbi:MAG: flagellar assembly protein FliX [Flavobacteriaceae bacterium]
MRIVSGQAVSGAGAAKGRRGARGGSGFSIDDAGESSELSRGGGVASIGSIDAIIALQSVDPDGGGRRRQVERGRDMLDELDKLKIALVSGRLDDAALDRLAGLLGSGRERADDPRLAGLIAEIELRARVELAKRGRFQF